MTLTAALAELHRQGRIASPWLPGSLWLPLGSRTIPLRVVDPAHIRPMPDDIPVLDDPATLGTLLALLREASGDPTRRVSPFLAGGWVTIDKNYAVVPGTRAPSEATALSAALIALAAP